LRCFPAGFVPYWIAYAVGAALLEIVSQAGSIGKTYLMKRISLEMLCEIYRLLSFLRDGACVRFLAHDNIRLRVHGK
jgi:hypothetical protein